MRCPRLFHMDIPVPVPVTESNPTHSHTHSHVSSLQMSITSIPPTSTLIPTLPPRNISYKSKSSPRKITVKSDPNKSQISQISQISPPSVPLKTRQSKKNQYMYQSNKHTSCNVNKHKRKRRKSIKKIIEYHCVPNENIQFVSQSRQCRCLITHEKIVQNMKLHFQVHEYLANAMLKVNIFSRDIGQEVSLEVILPIVVSEIYWVWSAAPRYNCPELLGWWLIYSTKIKYFAERIDEAKICYDLLLSLADRYLKCMLNKFARTIQLSFLNYQYKETQRRKRNITGVFTTKVPLVVRDGCVESTDVNINSTPPKERSNADIRKELLSHIATNLTEEYSSAYAYPKSDDTESDVSSLGNISIDDVNENDENSVFSDENIALSRQLTRGTNLSCHTRRSSNSTSKKISKFQMLRTQDEIKSWQLRKVDIVNAYFPRPQSPSLLWKVTCNQIHYFRGSA